MENIEDYKRFLAKKMIADFKKKFKDKIGYTPAIFDKYYTSKISLQQLTAIITPYLPTGKKLDDKDRSKDLLYWRYIFIGIAKANGYTYSSIGRHLKQHHATIMYGESMIPVFALHYPTFNEDFDKISNIIYEKPNRTSIKEESDSESNVRPMESTSGSIRKAA